MDLRENIFNNLNDKGYDDFTKIRWIYKYVCKEFSYDTRFYYPDPELKTHIYNRPVDISNVEDFEIVCYTFARILIDSLALFGFEAKLIRENNTPFSHTYVVMNYKNDILKLDPTKSRDVTRVKMNSTTLDFVSLTNEPFFQDQLNESDKIIASSYSRIDLDQFYNNASIMKLVDTVEESARNRNLTPLEAFYEKLEYIYSLINTRTDFTRYDDIDYYYSYLLTKFNINRKRVVINNEVISEAEHYVRPAVFFKKSDKSKKDIINISWIQYKNSPTIFYLIRKNGKNFEAREIFKAEAIELLKEYYNPACQFMFENAALGLSNEKNNNIIF